MFELWIKCSRPKPQDFAIFVNPSSVVLEKEALEYLVPVAWKVLRFAGDGNEEQKITFPKERTVGMTNGEGSAITPANSIPITQEGNSFVTERSGDAYRVILDKDNPSNKETARIFNNESSLTVFFGDRDSKPFVYHRLEPREIVMFEENIEIIVVAMRGYKGGQVIGTNIIGNWIKFCVKDMQQHANKLHVEYDNHGRYKYYSDHRTPFEEYGANVRIFPKGMGIGL